jgi:hypothetical protein
MITGKIEVAKQSKSGKSLGVKINDKWYSTTEWELQNLVGQVITITDAKDQHLDNGNTITWLNAYVMGGDGGAPTAQPANTTPKQYPNTVVPVDALLLEFVGRGMQTFQWTSSSLVAAQTRAKQLYELGHSILDGSIMKPETGPRTSPGQPRAETGGIPGYVPTMPESENPAPAGAAPQDEFDDDIPF